MTYLLLILFSLPSTLFASDVTVTLVKGEVTVENIAVTKGQVLKEGSEIRVNGPKSAAQFVFEDGSKMLVKDGVVKLEKSPVKKENLVKLVSGLLYSQKNKSEEKLKIVTRNAVLGVRGTKFYVQESAAETYLCVCEGLVNISNKTTSLDVGVREDALVKGDEKFAKTKANDMMWDMAQQGFKEMK